MWHPAWFFTGPLKFCLYLLLLCSILKHHNIGYHIYADDTQLYISFKCNDPLATLPKLNSCVSDIRVWMIKHKLKINDSKQNSLFSDLHKLNKISVVCQSVCGDSIILQSSKVRDFGVIFYQSLSFDDYISGVCRSTHFHLRNIGRIRSLLSYEATAQLPHALMEDSYCLLQIIIVQSSEVQHCATPENLEPGGADFNPDTTIMHDVTISLKF